MTKNQVIRKLRERGCNNIRYSGKEQKFYATSKTGVEQVFSKEGNLVKINFEGSNGSHSSN